QRVDHRNAGITRQGFDLVVREGAYHDCVDHFRQHARGVLDRFTTAELAVIGREEDRAAAHLDHCGLEGDARARRRLLEDHRQGVVLQNFMRHALALHDLQFAGALDDVPQFSGAEIGKTQEVSEAHARNSLTMVLTTDTTRSASVSLSVSGGARRMTLPEATLSSRPRARAWATSSPQGRSSSTPMSRSSERMAVTPSRPFSAFCRPLWICLPRWLALRSSFSLSSAS